MDRTVPELDTLRGLAAVLVLAERCALLRPAPRLGRGRLQLLPAPTTPDPVLCAAASLPGQDLCFLHVGLITYSLFCLTYTLMKKPYMTRFPAWIARKTKSMAARQSEGRNSARRKQKAGEPTA